MPLFAPWKWPIYGRHFPLTTMRAGKHSKVYSHCPCNCYICMHFSSWIPKNQGINAVHLIMVPHLKLFTICGVTGVPRSLANIWHAPGLRLAPMMLCICLVTYMLSVWMGIVHVHVVEMRWLLWRHSPAAIHTHPVHSRNGQRRGQTITLTITCGSRSTLSRGKLAQLAYEVKRLTESSTAED